jgi:hypothetical protein
MRIKCKYCGHESTLTEQESSIIAADLDRRFTYEEQARMVFTAICGGCLPEHVARIADAAEAGDVRLKSVQAPPRRKAA